MPKLRATVLESLRLWPDNPRILRETSTATSWLNGVLPAHTAVTILLSFSIAMRNRWPRPTAMLTDLLKHGRFRLRDSRLRAGQPLPAALNHFAVSFNVRE